MNIFQKFGASAAAAAMVATTAVTSVALPEVAEAQTIREPRSCQLLEREYQRDANDRRRIEQQASRDVGRSVNDSLRGRNRSGSTAGNILGSVLGGVAQIQVPKVFGGGERNIARLEAQCAEERQLQSAGICDNRTSERGTTETVNGRVVGSARGRIDESRNCRSQSYGNPAERTLTNPDGSNRDAGYSAAGGATGRDFSRCTQITYQNKPALACPSANGAPEIVPLPAATPAPRR